MTTGIVKPGHAIEIEPAITAPVAGAHGGYRDFAAADVGQKIVPRRRCPEQCRTDGPQACNADFQGISHIKNHLYGIARNACAGLGNSRRV
jgi:hypothetical protein